MTHHMSARVFVTSLRETTKYTLGLTATPIVKMVWATTWFIGRIVYRQDESDMKRPDVRIQTPQLPQRDSMQLSIIQDVPTRWPWFLTCATTPIAHRTLPTWLSKFWRTLRDAYWYSLSDASISKISINPGTRSWSRDGLCGRYEGVREKTSNGTPESSWRRFLRRRKGLTPPDWTVSFWRALESDVEGAGQYENSSLVSGFYWSGARKTHKDTDNFLCHGSMHEPG
jgi:hypothetical protein